MWMLVRTLLLLMALLAPAAIPAAQERSAPPDAGEGSCLDAGCHAEKTGGRIIHGAVEGGCEACHEHTGEGHRFQMALEPVEELCVMCHDAPEEKNLHAPVEMGECLLCHEPHSSDHESLLLAETQELCTECHSEQAEELALPHVHEIIDLAGCPACHDPHASAEPRLLRAHGNELCAECHEIPTGGHPIVRHPVEAASDPRRPEQPFWCASCHRPHGSEKEKLLLGPSGMGSCRQCHKK